MWTLKSFKGGIYRLKVIWNGIIIRSEVCKQKNHTFLILILNFEVNALQKKLFPESGNFSLEGNFQHLTSITMFRGRDEYFVKLETFKTIVFCIFLLIFFPIVWGYNSMVWQTFAVDGHSFLLKPLKILL